MAAGAISRTMMRSQVLPFRTNTVPRRVPAAQAAKPAIDFWPDVSSRLAREGINSDNAPGAVLREIGLILGAAMLFVLIVSWFVPAP